MNQDLKNQLMNIFLEMDWSPAIQFPQEDQLGAKEDQPGNQHETSFRGESQRTKFMKDYVKDLYKKVSENIGKTPELFHYDYFKLEGGELYFIGSRNPSMTEGKLKSVGMIADILGKNRLRKLGFNIPVGKVTARKAVMLNEAAEEVPSESDITKADDIKLQEISEKASGIISQINYQTQTDDLFEHGPAGSGALPLPLCQLLGLDTQLRSIRGSLKVEVAKRFSWKNTSLNNNESSRNFENILEFTMMQREKTSPSEVTI